NTGRVRSATPPSHPLHGTAYNRAMINPAQLYHIGVVVQDLDRAMDELGTALGTHGRPCGR
ncbi:MAG: hypothetical protein C0506_15830, partial [Anaerolinea sp.]|nr:hypothetical protein [Anaerolinea sp.]